MFDPLRENLQDHYHPIIRLKIYLSQIKKKEEEEEKKYRSLKEYITHTMDQII